MFIAIYTAISLCSIAACVYAYTNDCDDADNGPCCDCGNYHK